MTARDKTSPLTRSPVGAGALICGGLRCAFEECSVAGVLALSAPLAAHAVPLGSSTGAGMTVPASGVVKVWGGCGWG